VLTPPFRPTPAVLHVLSPLCATSFFFTHGLLFFFLPLFALLPLKRVDPKAPVIEVAVPDCASVTGCPFCLLCPFLSLSSLFSDQKSSLALPFRDYLNESSCLCSPILFRVQHPRPRFLDPDSTYFVLIPKPLRPSLPCLCLPPRGDGFALLTIETLKHWSAQ